jgi:hypothetical protein
LRRCSLPQTLATPSELREFIEAFSTQGFKANPGLKFANAFSVRVQTALSHLFTGLALRH